MCPFCYIGKRKFEDALSNFEARDQIEVEWKSYQLAQGIETDTSKNTHQFLAEHKNISITEAKALNAQVAEMAAQVGLEYNFDRSVVANTFNAHRLLHMAKVHGLQNNVKESLLRAYFTEGKNIDDIESLTSLASGAGLDADVVRTMLLSDEFADAVKADISEAHQIGVTGVPFFVIDRRFAVSGAQDVAVFSQALERGLAP